VNSTSEKTSICLPTYWIRHPRDSAGIYLGWCKRSLQCPDGGL